MNLALDTVSHQPLAAVGLALLLAFGGLAMFDGVWLHLVKYRLHARPESYAEHLWHTVSAVLFVPMALWLFSPDAGGRTLWLALSALVVMHVAELFDARIETESRRGLGGLSRGELAIHIGALVTRTGAVAALLWTRPLEAWSWSYSAPAAVEPTLLGLLQPGLVASAIVVAVVHVALAATWCPRCPWPGSWVCCAGSAAR